jgi:ubiquinone/menaquinone biosynthesis C-methylase UbiE
MAEATIELVSERIQWPPTTHEFTIERFYSRGALGFETCHGGYLNFGLWEKNIGDYVKAAEALVRRLAEWARIDQASELLDVACGTGSEDVYLAQRFSPRRIVGLDATWVHVLLARRRAKRHALVDHLHFYHGSATRLGFESSSFTHVLGIEGPIQFDTRESFFREALRILRPGGTLALADFGLCRTPSTLIDQIYVLLARRGWKIPAANCQTIEGYRKGLESAGFREVEILRIGEHAFPGYFREQCSKSYLERLTQVRGRIATYLSLLLDLIAYRMFKRGQLEYLLVKARKPS